MQIGHHKEWWGVGRVGGGGRGMMSMDAGITNCSSISFVRVFFSRQGAMMMMTTMMVMMVLMVMMVRMVRMVMRGTADQPQTLLSVTQVSVAALVWRRVFYVMNAPN